MLLFSTFSHQVSRLSFFHVVCFLCGVQPPFLEALSPALSLSLVFEFLTRFVTFQVVIFLGTPPALSVCFPAHIRQNFRSAVDFPAAQTII